jgi:hypothetical protein
MFLNLYPSGLASPVFLVSHLEALGWRLKTALRHKYPAFRHNQGAESKNRPYKQRGNTVSIRMPKPDLQVIHN